MKRYSPENDAQLHDLLIVGGGIYGASMAYTAALNGIKTVLVEQDDFCQHTSANSQKVIHGGLRYLQTLDVKRVIESIHEKQRFYHLFSHQVKPLPCLLPTSGFTMKGNEAFRIAFLLYGLIEKLVCRGKLTKNLHKRPEILTKNEVTERFSHMEKEDVRGGALWYDGICNDPERVVVSLLQSTNKLGGQVANHMKVVSIERTKENSLAVTLRDKHTQKEHLIHTRKIALCTGSWFKDELGLGPIPKDLEEISLIRGMNVIVPALFRSSTSFATKTTHGSLSRFLFIVPWKDYSIEGTHWEDCPDPSAPWDAQQKTTDDFHDLTQSALSSDRAQSPVMSTHVGYVPGTQAGKPAASDRIMGHYKLVDREKDHNGDIIQVVGVKFTTAFDVVKKSLKKLFPEQQILDILQFSHLPYGSPAGKPSDLFSLYRQRYKDFLSYEQCMTLFDLFGSSMPEVVKTAIAPIRNGLEPISDLDLYKGITSYCVHNEMVYSLEDLIYRRIFPDNAKPISLDLLNILAEELARLLHWTSKETKEEITKVIDIQEAWL